MSGTIAGTAASSRCWKRISLGSSRWRRSVGLTRNCGDVPSPQLWAESSLGTMPGGGIDMAVTHSSSGSGRGRERTQPSPGTLASGRDASRSFDRS